MGAHLFEGFERVEEVDVGWQVVRESSRGELPQAGFMLAASGGVRRERTRGLRRVANAHTVGRRCGKLDRLRRSLGILE